jgi:hypothetical protein
MVRIVLGALLILLFLPGLFSNPPSMVTYVLGAGLLCLVPGGLLVWSGWRARKRAGTPEAIWLSRQPRCAVCGITSDAYFEKMKARHQQGPLRGQRLAQIGNLVAVCPKCRHAFCNDHLISANPHDFFDEAKCPRDKTPLDADWDSPPSEERPWRIGPRPKDALTANSR